MVHSLIVGYMEDMCVPIEEVIGNRGPITPVTATPIKVIGREVTKTVTKEGGAISGGILAMAGSIICGALFVGLIVLAFRWRKAKKGKRPQSVLSVTVTLRVLAEIRCWQRATLFLYFVLISSSLMFLTLWSCLSPQCKLITNICCLFQC